MKQLAQVCRVPDLARYLGISERDLEQIIAAGDLPIVPPYGEPVVHHSDLETFLATRLAPQAGRLENLTDTSASA